MVLVAPRDNLQKTSARIESLPNISRKSVTEEAEYVEQGGFAGAVGANEYDEIGNIREVNVLKRLEVANRNGFQFHVSSMSGPWPSNGHRFKSAECVRGRAVIQAPSSVPFRYQFYGPAAGSVALPAFGEPAAPYPHGPNPLPI